MNPAAKANPLVEYVRRSMDLEDPTEIERRADELDGHRLRADGQPPARPGDAAPRGPAAAPHRTSVFRSPIPEASDEQWARFVRLMQTGDVAAVTPTGQVGIFQTRLKRLEDLGLAQRRPARPERRRAELDGDVSAAAHARAAALRPAAPVPDLRRRA